MTRYQSYCAGCGITKESYTRQEQQDYKCNCHYQGKLDTIIKNWSVSQQTDLKECLGQFKSFKNLEKFLESEKDIADVSDYVFSSWTPSTKEEITALTRLRKNLKKIHDNEQRNGIPCGNQWCFKYFIPVKGSSHHLCPRCIDEENHNTRIKPICQGCRDYLKQLKADTWELTKLRCKNEAKSCIHSPTPSISGVVVVSWFDKDKQEIAARPSIEIKTIGKCPEHGDGCEYHSNNTWGDEFHKKLNKKPNEIPPVNSSNISLTQIEQYFKQNNIKEIKRENNQLIITFISEDTENNLTVEQNQQLNTFLTDNHLDTLNSQQLNQWLNLKDSNNNKPTNYLPHILGTITLITAIPLTILLLKKRQKKITGGEFV